MSLITFKFKIPDFEKAFKAEQQNLLNLAAAVVQTQRAMIFDNEGAYNGRTKWKPLKFRQGMILSRRGDLRRSVGPRNDGKMPGREKGSILQFAGTKITIGSSLIYASIQNTGGVITPKKGKALKIPVQTKMAGAKRIGGKWYLFRKKVTIPARPFLDWTSQDQNEVNVTLTNRIKEIWNSAKA